MAVACTPKLQPPTAQIEPVSPAHAGVAVQLDGSKSQPGKPPDGEIALPLSFRWSFLEVPPGSRAALNDGTLAKPSFVPDLAGKYSVQLVVADGVFASVPVTTDVTATADCQPSVSKVNAAPAQPAVGEAVALSFDPGTPCEAAGTDGRIVAWKWTVVSAPAGSTAEIAHASSPNASFVPDRRGDYELALQVTDALGLTSLVSDANAHVKVTAQSCGDNVPEVQEISSTPEKPNVQQLVQLGATVRDADTLTPCTFKRAISFEWTINALPAGSKATLNDRHATNPSFTPDVPGDYVIALVATDDLGRPSPQRTFTVSTTQCGSAVPVAEAVAPSTAFAGQGLQLGVKVTNADNPAGDGLNSPGAKADPAATGCSVDLSYAYHWRLLAAPKGSTAALNDANLANPSLTTDVPGDYLVSVTATASTGKSSAPAFATITVSECGSLKPQVELALPSGAITGAPVRLEAKVTDPNATCRPSTSFAYSWSLVAAPAGSLAALSGTTPAGRSVEQNPSFTPDLAGSYTIGLVVTDSAGLASDAKFQVIEVSACNAPLTVVIDAPAGAITGTPVMLTAAVTDPNAPPASSGGDSGTPDAGDGSVAPDAGDGTTGDVDAGDGTTGDVDAGDGTVTEPDAGSDTGTPDAGSPPPTPAATCTRDVLPYSYQWTLVGLPAGSHAAINNASASAPSFVGDLPGTYTVQLVVTDAAGNHSPAITQQVQVAHCTAPLDVAINDVTGAAAGIPLSLTATVADPNEPATTNSCSIATAPYFYSWSIVGLPAGSRARLNNAASVSPSFTPDVNGAYTLALQVTDAAGNRSPVVTSTVTVSATCTAPLTASITGTAGPAGLPITLGATVTDPNTPATGNKCTVATAPYQYKWAIVGLPTGSRAQLNNASSAAPSFTPDADGSYTIALQVTDAAGNQSPTVTTDLVTTGRCNAPLTASINSVTGAAAGVPVGLGATITDPNTPNATNGCTATTAPYSYTWSLVGLPTGSRATLNNAASAAPSFTPDATGTYAIALSVVDAAGNRSATVTQNVTVSSTCTAPVTATINTVAGAAAGVPVALTASITDPNTPATGNACTAATTPYSYTWSLVGLPTGSRATLNNTASSGPSFTPDAVGAYTVALQVVDAAGNRSATVTSTVTVSATCTAPLTATVTAPAGAAVGVPFSVTANVTDPNTPSATNSCTAPTAPFSYAWSLVALPTGSRAALNNASSAAPSLTPDQTGVYTLALVVTDAAGNKTATLNKDVTVTGNCNAPLTATFTTVAGITGTPVQPTVAITDPNTTAAGCAAPGAISYAWRLVGLPAGSTARLNNATAIKPSFVPDLAGAYTLELTASDALGNKSAPTQTTIAVSNCTAPLGVTINAPAGASTLAPVQLSATVTDANIPGAGNSCTVAIDPNAHAYAWFLASLPAGSAAKLNNTASKAPSFQPDKAGTYTLGLEVTDAAGNKGVATQANVVVANCTAPLSPTLAVAGTAATLQTLTFTATPGNPNPSTCGTLTPATAAWTLVSRPARSTASLSPNALVATLVPDVAGAYTVSAKVTDALGNSGTVTQTTAVAGCGGSGNVAVAVRGPSSGELGAAINLIGAVTDTNNTACSQPTAAPFSYAWTLTTPAGSGATLSNATGAKPSFSPDVAGTYTAALTVTDALGYQASATQTITAFACPATVTIAANPGNPVTTYQSVRLTASVTFPASCTQPPSLSYQWLFDLLPTASNAQFQNPNQPSAVFQTDTSGSWVARVYVQDNVSGQVYSQTATVTTTACGTTAPTAKIGVGGSQPAGTTVVAQNYATPSAGPAVTATTLTAVQLDGTQSLAPNISSGCLPGPVTYQWTLYQVPPGSSTSIKLDTAGKPSLSFDVAGEYVVQLIVNDGVLGSAPSYLRFSK